MNKVSHLLVILGLILALLFISDRIANSGCPGAKRRAQPAETEAERQAREERERQEQERRKQEAEQQSAAERERSRREGLDNWEKSQMKESKGEETKKVEKKSESKGEESKKDDQSSQTQDGDSETPSGGGGISRPPLDIGLQPRIQNVSTATNFLVGVAEPWEVWWTFNRERYLNFRQPIEWEKVTGEDATRSVVKYKIYTDLFNILSDALQGKDMTLAWNAAVAIGRSGHPDANAQLQKAYQENPHVLVQNYALVGLGWLGATDATDFLGKALADKTAFAVTRSHAAVGLGYINHPSATAALKNTITAKGAQPDVDIIASSLFSLGLQKDASAIPILDNYLNGGQISDMRIRSYAALALGHIGNKDALQKLKKAVNDKNNNIRMSVAIALGSVNEPKAKDELLSLLQDKSEPVRGMAAIALAQSVIKYPSKKHTPKVMGDRLLKLRQECKRSGQGLTIMALGILGDERAKPEFKNILADRKKSDLVKGSAIIGLGLLKDKEAVPVLIDLFQKRPDDPILSPYIILALGMIGDEPATEALLPIWAQADKNISRVAYTNLAVALTMLGKRKEVIDQLVKHSAKGQNSSLRQYALHTLGIVGDRESAQAFVDACTDENDASIKSYAVTGIGLLLEKSPVPLITYWISTNNTEVSTLIIEHLLPIPAW